MRRGSRSRAKQDQEAAMSSYVISIIYILLSFLRLDSRYLMIVLMDLKIEQIEKKLKKFRAVERLPAKTWPVKSLPVKTLASEAPRGHVTTGYFSTDKVYDKTQMPLNSFRRFNRYVS
jgi:hypothetical protein